MPFMASGGGGASAPAPAGPVTMQVEPGQILALKARYEAVRDTIQDYLISHRRSLRVQPFAKDDVSTEAAPIFTNNTEIAIDVTEQFLDQLNISIDQLDQTAKTYNLTEDTNENRMRQQHREI
ncbi:PE domain-containing protein [Saccharothrix sp. 6-C]|uniref:PE domain-containing protein n=1 Tax=Saccharothrix sp. 6-C TaxID=2781735 RepID=UPI001916F691|nr:PE domain-containing protein [Saccharothrix sp. 6-C]QQQ78041.1 PE domain-containing protein [Saccharothrix sp. 6-C]